MRRKFLASTALTTSTVFAAGVAWAADLPVKAPPPARAPLFSWTGCYAGLNAGGAWNRVEQDVIVPGDAAFNSSGTNTSFTGGGQIGCNWQFDPNWVIGLEGDINYLNGKRTQAFHFRGEDTILETKLSWLGTVRARLGYAWGRSFLYGTGGVAFGEVKSSVFAPVGTSSLFAGSVSEVRAGWTAGVGFEYAFADHWSAKLEYLHYDLGTVDYLVNLLAGSGGGLPSTWNASAKVSGDLVRVGVNYRFGP
jgi:outer membrane immunogenic protein